MVDCFAVLRCTFSRVRWRVLLGAALFVAASASYGLAATDARAGTPAWDMVQTDSLVAGAPEVVVPESGAQQAATTEQAAGAAASASQEQPQNIVITIRINSPGVDGPITQTNIVVSGAGGSNAATTSQNGVPATGGGAAPSQNAATGQQAGSVATASQDGAGNLVVVVRINSPGDNGPISQTNAAVAGANAANTSTTNQGEPAAGAEPAASASEGAPAPRRPARKPAAKPPRKEPAAARSAAQPAVSPAAPASRQESSTAAAVDRAHASHPSVVRAHRKAKPAPASSLDRGTKTPLHRVASGAANIFDAVAPRTPVATQESADVSGPVVYSLLFVLAALAAFLVWPQRPEWFRRVLPRTRLRG